MGEAEPARYSAFLSYSHQDAAFARRLQRLLESYQVPRRLAASDVLRPGSRRLLPVFRDRDELTASADLTGAVRAALAEARFLIVVCSPAASASEWVSREVALFRELHGAARVLCALHPGTAKDAVPAALAMLADGGAQVPLAADFRKGGDGERLALLKLVAVLAGVRLDELVQRDAHRRVQRLSVLAAGAVAGMVVAGGLAWEALRARNAAERAQARSERMVDFLLTDLRPRLEGEGRLDIMDAVTQGALSFFAGQDLRRLPDNELQQRAALLQQIGQDDDKRGDYKAAQQQFAEAERTTAALLSASPADPGRIDAEANSQYWLGYIAWRQGDDNRALAGYTAYANLARRLIDIAPNKPEYLVEDGYADSNLAAYTLHKSADVNRALPLLEAAQKDFQTVALKLPGEDRDTQVAIADGYAWLADAERLRGDILPALHDRQLQRDMVEALLAKDPRNFDTRTYRPRYMLGLARLDAANHYWRGANALLAQAAAEAAFLHQQEPQNATVARQMRAIGLFQARTWLSMPAEQQPPAATIAAAIGDCAAESAKPNNEEVASFCTIEQARLIAATGDQPGATRLLASLHLDRPARDRLTYWWFLDLREEAKMH